MVTSGARGNWLQVRNIAGMRGLVNNPKGEIIPRPIISSYREGLSVAEYFIATHGARKGLADTALRTADSGYLTRRLVDVSQDVIIREDDCGTTKGLDLTIATTDAAGSLVRDPNVENAVYARSLAADAVDAKGEVVAEAGEDVGDVLIDKLLAAGVETIKVRSVLTCESAVGVCAKCYGRSLATGKLVDIGEAVGIIAAQSIGEPGTQLTMRTFHTGGSASADDITQGLPRVQELFEARTPKGASPIVEAAGRITIDETERQRKVILTPDNGDEPIAYNVLKRSTLLVEDGQHVELGQQLIVGTVDPKEVLRVKGVREVQKHLVDGVQDVYRSQGVPIHDKHIEVIVRQMLRKVTVVDHGDTDLLPGELVDRFEVQRDQPCCAHRGQEDGLGPPGGHGYHQGLARDRVVAVGRVLPGDDPRAHAGRHGGQVRPARRPQGERDHRQADPRGHRPPAGTGASRSRPRRRRRRSVTRTASSQTTRPSPRATSASSTSTRSRATTSPPATTADPTGRVGAQRRIETARRAPERSGALRRPADLRGTSQLRDDVWICDALGEAAPTAAPTTSSPRSSADRVPRGIRGTARARCYSEPIAGASAPGRSAI